MTDADQPGRRWAAESDLALIALRHARQAARCQQPAPARPRAHPADLPQSALLSAVLFEAAAEYGWPVPEVHPVVARWSVLAGERLAAGLTAIGFDPATNTLTLQGASTAWAAQGRLLAKRLIEQVNGSLNADVVRTVRILAPAQTEPDSPSPPATTQEPGVLAAVRRQDRRVPREPAHLFTGVCGPEAAPRRSDVVRAAALARARAAKDGVAGQESSPPPPR
ncbi:DciA family protein [Streptomyces sp. NPDC021100]|uniref:DciA family protein n=1 Tax=Streptomyces sp. NPDC021100 TaxID=3365114 RepID=UPI0037AC72B3